MTKPCEGWAVVGPGGICRPTVRRTEDSAWMAAIAAQLSDKATMERMGYRCIKVRIVPVEEE